MTNSEAMERVNNILQLLYLETVDYKDIAVMLVPNAVHSGIWNEQERISISKEILRVYYSISYHNKSNAAWIALQMFCGDDPDYAANWLYKHNYWRLAKRADNSL
jgi:hypothetical protein